MEPLNIRTELDAYDRMPASEFHHKPFRRTRKQKHELNQLIRTQKTGHESKSDWWERYSRYIHSPRWKSLKDAVMRERGVSCERCNASGSITKVHLHHLTYERLGRERMEDVQLLCERCHGAMHPGKDISFTKKH